MKKYAPALIPVTMLILLLGAMLGVRMLLPNKPRYFNLYAVHRPVASRGDESLKPGLAALESLRAGHREKNREKIDAAMKDLDGRKDRLWYFLEEAFLERTESVPFRFDVLRVISHGQDPENREWVLQTLQDPLEDLELRILSLDLIGGYAGVEPIVGLMAQDRNEKPEIREKADAWLKARTK